MSHIALGIGIGLIASGLQSFGLTLQRRSHVEDQKLPEREQSSEYRRPLFLLGFSIFITSNLIGSVLQIIVLPIIILAPLGAISLLWNALFARLILGDLFSPWLIFGTLGIIAGALLIAIFGIVPEPTHSLEDLIRLFSRPTFITYFTLLGVAVIVCLAITHIAEYTLSRRIADDRTLAVSMHEPSVATTGLIEHFAEDITATETSPLLPRTRELDASSHLSSLSSDSTKALSPSVERTRVALSFSYASFSGIISGMCLLFAKSGVELLVLTIKGDNQFWRWQAWMLFLGLIAFALLQLWYLHKALVLANPILVCPSAFCFYNLSSIVNGLVYFDQFSLIPPFHLGLVSLGIIVLLAGVWLVTIQSGGEGVDIVPWNADDEESIISVESENSSVVNLVETVESGKRSPPSQPPASHSDTTLSSALPRSSQEVTNSSIRSALVQSAPSMTYSRELPTPTFVQRNDQGAISDIPEPSTIHRPRTSHHGRSTSFAHPHHHSHISPALGEAIASTLAAGGLQIGLSPISPGFSLVPRRSRRMSTTATGGREMLLSRSDTLPPLHSIPSTSHHGSLSYTGLGYGHPPSSERRRRTVSEGDVGRMANLPSLASAAEDLSHFPIPRVHSPSHDSVPPRTSWGWLRRIIRRS